MTADEKGLGSLAGENGPQIRSLVHFDLHRQLLELLAEPGARMEPHRGPGDALSAVGVRGQLPKLTEVFKRSAGVKTDLGRGSGRSYAEAAAPVSVS